METMSVKLIRGNSYTLPVSKRTVTSDEIIEVTALEYEKLKKTGRFLPVPKDQSSMDGLFLVKSLREPARHLPENWYKQNICVKCVGGLGDTLIAASLAKFLKIRECKVTYAVTDRYMDIMRRFVDINETVDVKHLNDPRNLSAFDVLLTCSHAFVDNGKLTSKDYYTALFQHVGIDPKFIVVPQLYTVYKDELRLRKLTSKKPLIGIHTGASNPARRWGNEKWISLCNKLIDSGANLVFFGNDDFSISDNNAINLWDHTSSLVDQATILKQCDYFIGNDSGFAHMAGILRVPGSIMFSLSKPEAVIARYPKLTPISQFKELGIEPSLTLRNDDPNAQVCMEHITVESVFNSIPKDVFSKYSIKKTEMVSARTRRVQINKQPKILFVIPTLSLGGGEIITGDVVRGLSKYYHVDVFSLSENGYYPSEDLVNRYTDSISGKLMSPTRDITETLESILKTDGYDVVIYNEWKDSVYRILNNIESRPVVIRWAHTEESRGVSSIKAQLALFDEVVCVSPNIQSTLGAGVFLPNSVNPDRIAVTSPIDFGFENDYPVLGYVGRIDSQKGIPWFIENMKGIPVNFVVVGIKTERERKALEYRAATADVKDRVRLYDVTRDVGNYYCGFDVNLLLSEYEGMPLSVLEAGYHNIPSLCTPVGCLPQLFQDKHNIVFTSRDVSQIKEIIQSTDWETIGKNMGEEVNSKYLTDTHVNAFRKIINKTCGSTWPEDIQNGTIKFSRFDGAGDVIMTTSTVSRAREMFPKAKIIYQTTPVFSQILQGNPHIDELVVGKIAQAANYSQEFSYYDCWKRGEHAAVAMGGNKEDFHLTIPQELFDKVRDMYENKFKGQRVIGIWPYQNNLSVNFIKEWPKENWVRLGKLLKERSITPIQLGAHFHKDVYGYKQFKFEGIIDSIVSLLFPDLVVTVDCLANHALKALNKRGVVLWGGASKVWLTGYDFHRNIETPSKHGCFGSVCASTFKIGQCCGDGSCMKEIDVETVFHAIIEELRLDVPLPIIGA